MIFDRILCYLEDSVNLMSLSVCETLSVGKLKYNYIYLQLDDQSVKYQMGILKYDPINVGKLFIHVEFVVLEMGVFSNSIGF